jgi:hypothetical protein
MAKSMNARLRMRKKAYRMARKEKFREYSQVYRAREKERIPKFVREDARLQYNGRDDDASLLACVLLNRAQDDYQLSRESALQHAKFAIKMLNSWKMPIKLGRD